MHRPELPREKAISRHMADSQLPRDGDGKRDISQECDSFSAFWPHGHSSNPLSCKI